MHISLFLIKILIKEDNIMINVKVVDENSMLVAFEFKGDMFLLGPPYNLKSSKVTDQRFINTPTIVTFSDHEQLSDSMNQMQKLFAASLSNSILTKYAAGIAKNFTPSETRSLFIKRLEDYIYKKPFPAMLLHELHALQMTSGFSQKEITKLTMMLKDADDDLKTKIFNRLQTPTLDYKKDVDRYLNSIMHYIDINSKDNGLKAAIEKSRSAISHLIKSEKNTLPENLKNQIDSIYSHLNDEYKEVLKANGEYYIKPWQLKYNIEEPGVRFNKR